MLDAKQCDAFLAVIETGSFEQASLQLHVTASAISLRIQSLEQDLEQVLLLRERPCKPTHAGQTLLTHLKKIRLLEQDLKSEFNGQLAQSNMFKASIATNADTLATWLLPALADVLIQENIILNLHVDDQTQTHHLLQSGQVNACISTKPHTMQGCEVQFLGSMRYQMVASTVFMHKWFPQGVNREALRHAPAVIFNDKDHMHHEILLQHFGLSKTTYPYHLIPSSESFVQAVEHHLGYGMVPEYQLQSTSLHILDPALSIEVGLYWHHWQTQSVKMQTITQHIQRYCAQNLNHIHF